VTYGGVEPPIPGTMGPMPTVSQTPAPQMLLATPGDASRAATHASRSLGSQLERDRLERRAARVRQVIHALRERAAARDAGAGTAAVPRPLRAAIEDFGRELAELERRLRHHAPTVGGPGR